MLNPDYPIVGGRYRMTKDWELTLPKPCNRRFEDGSLVLWRPGFTVWTVIWNNDNCESISQRLAALKLDASPQAFDALEESDEQIVRYCYRLAEDADDERQPALNSFALDDDGHVQMSIYFDDPNDLVDALSIWRSLKSSSSD